MSNHINWDVCPEWVTFNRGRSPIQERPLEDNILFEEEEEDQCHQPNGEGVTGKAIPLPHGSHYHKVHIKNGHHMMDKRTGPAIRVGRLQHFHFIQ